METLLALLSKRRKKLPDNVKIVFSDGRKDVEEELKSLINELKHLIAYLQLKENGYKVKLKNGAIIVVDEEFDHVMGEIERVRRLLENIRKKGAREA